jgi:hypothetical protein
LTVTSDVAIGWLVALVLSAQPASASDLIFKWADEHGNLHITDRLGDVPEPYYSMYAAEVKRREQQAKTANRPAPSPEKRVSQPSPALPASRAPSIVEREIARRNKWKKLVAHWRTQLRAATAEVERLDAELDGTQLNPLLRHTPQVKARRQAIEARRQQALVRLEQARWMLLEEIPARAKKENVPPKWLL